MAEAVAELAVGKNVSLYPSEWMMLDQIAKDYGLGSRSAAVRYILHNWAKMKTAQASTGSPHGHGEKAPTPTLPRFAGEGVQTR